MNGRSGVKGLFWGPPIFGGPVRQSTKLFPLDSLYITHDYEKIDPVIDDPATASTTNISGPLAIASCAAMVLSYVAILYAPTLLLCLPPSTSLDNFMMRRFACALVSSTTSAALTTSIIGVSSLVFPLLLTLLVYSGSLALEFWLVISGRRGLKSFGEWVYGMLYNVMAWRNYVVAPFTDELVFRACMIPLLLCSGFNRYNIIFLSPVFFSLAHLNHFLELCCQQKYPFSEVLLIRQLWGIEDKPEQH
ncbi:CAAX prenyl protease 2-like [Asparagus officinalis]|uniref:CAAX prenyl protease 2-like n=1 Tax=Asparagus officinalis TaxID=4686 RepID=UPI00098E71C9|nr:CAAX prenyl protease 2-like [Asparagus officinalis]